MPHRPLKGRIVAYKGKRSETGKYIGSHPKGPDGAAHSRAHLDPVLDVFRRIAFTTGRSVEGVDIRDEARVRWLAQEAFRRAGPKIGVDVKKRYMAELDAALRRGRERLERTREIMRKA